MKKEVEEEEDKEEEKNFEVDIYKYYRDDMIIYSDKKTIEKFKESNYLFIDGTFSICPEGWYQLYTLNGLVKGKRITFFYCLLKKRQMKYIKKCFRKLMN